MLDVSSYLVSQQAILPRVSWCCAKYHNYGTAVRNLSRSPENPLWVVRFVIKESFDDPNA